MYPHVRAVAEACVGAVRPGDERNPNEAVGCGSRTMVLAQPAKLGEPPRLCTRYGFAFGFLAH
jgi:hypothetical protein